MSSSLDRMIERRNSRKGKSLGQEERGASRHGGRVQPGSGGGPRHKADVRTATHSIEYKRTDKKSIIIKLEDLEKVRMEALLEGRKPLFGIEIGGRGYLLVPEEDYNGDD